MLTSTDNWNDTLFGVPALGGQQITLLMILLLATGVYFRRSGSTR